MRECRSSILVLSSAAAVAGLALVGAMAAGTRAGVIYHDTFARTGDLNNTAPSPTDTGAAPWTAYAQTLTGTYAGTYTITTNGSAAVIPQANGLSSVSATLPVSLQPNTTYVFSATLTPNASGANGESNSYSSSDWIAMGLGQSVADINTGSTEAWLIYRGNSGTQSFYGGHVNNAATGGYGNGSKELGAPPDTFDISLTTSLSGTTASLAFWDSLGLIGTSGSPRTGSLGSTQLANVQALIIGEVGWGGTVQNLQFASPPIPEPKALSLLAMGAAALLVIRKRRCA